ncbi:MAG TPA: hypothetical protein VNB64_03875 [Solirubrobacteraceae bacterium]|nr:hypothetical protein [Solirubrobacteraceae bacterium]
MPSPPGSGAVRAIFGGLASLRGGRALHPNGVVVRGTFRATGPGGGAELLAPGVERAVDVRFSRGAGVPDPLPDVRGCAIRVVDAYGPGRHQDFPLASSFSRPAGRHALVPGMDFFRAFYSSVLPYRIAGETRLVAATLDGGAGEGPGTAGIAAAARAGRLRVRLATATPRGPWEEVATLELDAVAPPADARALRFNPWNSGGGIRPAGWLMALRDPAYRGSQAAVPDAG